MPPKKSPLEGGESKRIQRERELETTLFDAVERLRTRKQGITLRGIATEASMSYGEVRNFVWKRKHLWEKWRLEHGSSTVSKHADVRREKKYLAAAQTLSSNQSRITIRELANQLKITPAQVHRELSEYENSAKLRALIGLDES
ncbi:hypothetical protein HY969_01805 [Candidatus Kaiserbacteria bacterium]|nr:hypothetical protein [Candidatus Kaiserbacteria bacterium]